jgi:site-specific DNA-cytosine methylase
VTSVIDRARVAVVHHSLVEVSYVLLGSKREKVRLAGNAVTPPVPSMIVPRLMEVLDG